MSVDAATRKSQNRVNRAKKQRQQQQQQQQEVLRVKNPKSLLVLLQTIVLRRLCPVGVRYPVRCPARCPASGPVSFLQHLEECHRPMRPAVHPPVTAWIIRILRTRGIIARTATGLLKDRKTAARRNGNKSLLKFGVLLPVITVIKFRPTFFPYLRVWVSG